jgi:hypothetical protein
MNLRLLLASIALAYLIVFMVNLFGGVVPSQWKEPAAYALLALAVVALGLHVALVVMFRSWMNAFLAFACMLALLVLIFRALMIVTGDSL